MCALSLVTPDHSYHLHQPGENMGFREFLNQSKRDRRARSRAGDGAVSESIRGSSDLNLAAQNSSTPEFEANPLDSTITSSPIPQGQEFQGMWIPLSWMICLPIPFRPTQIPAPSPIDSGPFLTRGKASNRDPQAAPSNRV